MAPISLVSQRKVSLKAHGATSNAASHSYRSDIDGLRAIAVLSVLFYHAFPSLLKGGFAGVDVFFVISGFLISGIIFRELDQGRFSFLAFYTRRVRRIFPSLVLILLVAFVSGWLLLLPDEYQALGKHLAGSAVFINNFQLWQESGYFDGLAALKPLLHLWSLGIEEQFYISYPFFVWLLWKRTGFFAALVSACVLSFLLNVALIHPHAVATFYSPATRVWELLAGGVLAYLSFTKRELPAVVSGLLQSSVARRWCREAVSGFGLLCLTVAMVFLNTYRPYPGWYALLPVVGTVLLIAAGERALINRHILGNRVAVFFGLISYPLYLWHWILLSFASIVTFGTASAGLRGALVLASIVLAWISYLFIEKPFRFGTLKSRLGLGILVGGMAIIGLAGLAVYLKAGIPSRIDSSIVQGVRDVTAISPISREAKCPADLRAMKPALGYCEGSDERPPTAVVWGDSHGERIFNGISEVDTARDWALAGNAFCAPTANIEVVTDAKDCVAQNRNILKYLTSNSTVKTVLLGFFGNYAASSNYAAYHVMANWGPAQMLVNAPGTDITNKWDKFAYGLDSAIAPLVQAGKNVIIVTDIPELPFLPNQCAARPFFAARECLIARAEVDARQRDLRAMLAGLKVRHPEIGLFDPLDIICGKEKCSIAQNGTILYSDSTHLSPRGSVIVGRKLKAFIDSREAAR